MGIGTSLVLIAIGAILKYAVADTLDGVELGTIGVILMALGGLGLLISLLYTMIWADRTRPAERVVEDRPVDTVTRRERVERW